MSESKGDESLTPLLREHEIGPEALKAFAHPLRMAMYNYLSEQGAATASQLARHLGESSGQTSYHLRQLERHGFVEDDPAHPRGRDRWWRAVGFSVEGRDMLADPRTAEAARALLQGVVAERAQVLSRWMAAPEPDPRWRAASMNDRSTADLTADELHDVVLAMQTVMQEHLDRAKARKDAGETTGRRRARIYLDALPLPPDDQSPNG